MKTSDVTYEETPVERIDVDPAGSHVIGPYLPSHENVVSAVRRQVGDSVQMRRASIGDSLVLWERTESLNGTHLKTKEALHFVGYPGLDVPIDAIEVYRGKDPLGNDVYAIAPKKGDDRLGFIEVVPVKY
ncbi:MAG: hypothetical protein V1813_03830 [Candidatus Aenigmatarchaeota archaeon]